MLEASGFGRSSRVEAGNIDPITMISAVAVALIAEGSSRMRAFLIASATALVEPIGGFLGVGAVTLFQVLLPWALTFAAGAMLYVISHEIIPETHSRGFQREATVAFG